jgi:energy-converting hydrogenase B subunit D
MIALLTILLCAGILISGLLAVQLDNIVSAVISSGLASLAAPDVAMTEASIGSGLSTMIFLYAIRKTRNGD